jgi:serine/threonine-protein kinase
MKAARANEVQVPIWWAARVVADAAEGLHAAHELRAADGHPLNVVHRDVSPQNVHVTRDGVVKVLDFGVASARDRLQSTTKGQIKGKVAYMAPEQLRGEPVDRTADVWALGVLVWELVAGEALFQRSTGAATYGAVMRAAAPRLRERRPEIPAALDTLIARALDPSPTRRVATAREMARGLLPFALLEGAPVGMPDIAIWTEALLPGESERQRQDVERALHHAPSGLDLGASSRSEGGAVASPGSRVRGRRIARLALVAALIAAAGGLGIGLAESRLGWATDPADSGRSAHPSSTRRDAGSSTSALATDPGTFPLEPPGVQSSPLADAGPDPGPAVADSRAEDTGAADTKQLRPRPVAAGRGSVNIATPGGWAEVWYRGQKLGTTPIQVTLPAGVQRLELRPFGRRPGHRVQTRVRADRVTRVRHSLTE